MKAETTQNLLAIEAFTSLVKIYKHKCDTENLSDYDIGLAIQYISDMKGAIQSIVTRPTDGEQVKLNEALELARGIIHELEGE